MQLKLMCCIKILEMLSPGVLFTEFDIRLLYTHTVCLKNMAYLACSTCVPVHVILTLHPSTCLQSFMLCSVWLPRLLWSFSQVWLWSSISNCSGLARGEEECSHLTSGSAPWPHDYIHASMFDEMESISFIRGRVYHRACTAVLIGFVKL